MSVVVTADTATLDPALEPWRGLGAVVMKSEAPRGARLREAARQSAGDVLLFLHADTLLPEGWDEAVRGALSEGAAGGAFRLAFQGAGRRLRWVAGWANLRTAFTRVPYGDQAPFVRRDVYEALGGHAPWPLLEDVELFERVKRAGRIAILPLSVETSPRRYETLGIARTVLTNWKTLLLFRLGASPDSLARAYRRSGTPGTKIPP
ncbi:MAG: glycosyltransferase family 2 protein [Acidobacteria bacterium]|nr:glycosyltransferase family 2 protein [Acidobacteriota bacterium]